MKHGTGDTGPVGWRLRMREDEEAAAFVWGSGDCLRVPVRAGGCGSATRGRSALP